MKTSKCLTIGLAGLLTLGLSGCITINQVAPEDSGNSMNHDMDHMVEGEYSNMDIMFAQMMIPHHQQAVDMSNLALEKSSNGEILALAKQIKDAQAPEIQEMEHWLEHAGVSGTIDHDMDHGMEMGMLSAEELAALTTAEGTEFDLIFLEGMIAHHEGAIDMAQMILGSENAEAKALAEAIISSQTEEIELMKALLAKLRQ